MVPILMTGLAVGFAFRMGLFNIGELRTIYDGHVLCAVCRLYVEAAGESALAGMYSCDLAGGMLWVSFWYF